MLAFLFVSKVTLSRRFLLVCRSRMWQNFYLRYFEMKLSDPFCLYPDARGQRKAVRYKVEDMPNHEAADIALLNGHWWYFRVSHGVSWVGEFKTEFQALRELESAMRR